jgi:hypothetical protein
MGRKDRIKIRAVHERHEGLSRQPHCCQRQRYVWFLFVALQACSDGVIGMFLYATLVMQNLYASPTRDDLTEEVKQTNFPDDLKEA